MKISWIVTDLLTSLPTIVEFKTGNDFASIVMMPVLYLHGVFYVGIPAVKIKR